MPFEIETMRGTAAAVMQMLMDAGLKEKDAGTFVLKHLPAELKPASTKNAPTWRTVQEWRYVDDNVYRKTGYDLTLELWPPDGTEPERHAKNILDWITRSTKRTNKIE